MRIPEDKPDGVSDLIRHAILLGVALAICGWIAGSPIWLILFQSIGGGLVTLLPYETPEDSFRRLFNHREP